MHRVEPTVFCVGEVQTNRDQLKEYLSYIGADSWETDADISGIEEIIEIQGRGCYKSFGTELNANLTRVRNGNQAYMENIINVKHGSVIEHGFACFQFCDVSRVLTAELCRHRVGVAISEQSLRFVRMKDMGLWIPPCFGDIPDAIRILEEHWWHCEEDYQALLLCAAEKETGEGTPGAFDRLSFALKKKYTSAARRVAPMGIATNIGWSCNMRTLRHVIEQRTDPTAEEEIRFLFGKVGYIAMERWPNVFRDYQVTEADGLPQFITESKKI